jgi:hypothetical protein
VRAITQADSTNSPNPLIEYLRQPGAKLGSSECWWLQQLLDRIKFKRKKGGRFVPLGQKSQKEINEVGAAHVRHLQQSEGMSQPDAIDRVVKMYPEWFGVDAGSRLANYIKRGV